MKYESQIKDLIEQGYSEDEAKLIVLEAQGINSEIVKQLEENLINKNDHPSVKEDKFKTLSRLEREIISKNKRRAF